MSVVHRLDARAVCAGDGILVRLGDLLSGARLDGLIRKKGDLVAIKVDVGEPGNVRCLRPALVRAVVEQVQTLGGDPVLIDTTRLNDTPQSIGRRWMDSAAIHGFTQTTLGRPVTLGDGYTGKEGELLPVDGNELGGVEVARSITEYASLIVVSHVTGHPFAGLGGALVALGLGGCAQNGKWRIHAPLRPRVAPDLCDGCGCCVEHCLYQAICVDDGCAAVDAERCRGCAYYCIAACPCDALRVDSEAVQRFQMRVVEAAGAVHVAAQGRLHFLSFLLDVVPQPDAYPFTDVAVTPDLGVLSSRDPVAIDQAALDLIDSAPGLPGSLAETHGALRPGPGKLVRITGVDPEPMLAYAQEYGLGTRQYELNTAFSLKGGRS